MSEPFLAEIRIFAGHFAPAGWAYCNGQLLPISQNTAYFSLVGTTYGGDGETTFALPNLEDRVPIGKGNGPGLPLYAQGQKGGSETVALTVNEMPAHTHAMTGTDADADARTPANARYAHTVGDEGYALNEAGTATSPTEASGTGAAHNNMQPYLVMSYITALVGVYPS